MVRSRREKSDDNDDDGYGRGRVRLFFSRLTFRAEDVVCMSTLRSSAVCFFRSFPLQIFRLAFRPKIIFFKRRDCPSISSNVALMDSSWWFFAIRMKKVLRNWCGNCVKRSISWEFPYFNFVILLLFYYIHLFRKHRRSCLKLHINFFVDTTHILLAHKTIICKMKHKLSM